jgi:hypothetical protein
MGEHCLLGVSPRRLVASYGRHMAKVDSYSILVCYSESSYAQVNP